MILKPRFWICDPHNGVANVKSDFLLKVWHKFRVHNIEIPFPQRDLNLKSGTPLSVHVTQQGGGPTPKISKRSRRRRAAKKNPEQEPS